MNQSDSPLKVEKLLYLHEIISEEEYGVPDYKSENEEDETQKERKGKREDGEIKAREKGEKSKK